jgi:hypothetical protein
MNLKTANTLLGILLLAFGGANACGSSAKDANHSGLTVSGESSDASGSMLTYYHDVQPIIQAKCAQCHNPQGIAPFPFETPNDVISRTALIGPAVSTRTMPPWPPSDACNTYDHDRSLTQDQITTITSWIAGGAPVGDPSDEVTGQPPTGLSRVDLTLEMPTQFTPTETPDDYRCFLIPWTPTTAKYVTGLGVRPGDPHIVHHAIAFIATPGQIASYQALDDADPGPGWTCFGGPGIGAQAQWLGAWAPGTLGSDFPTGTGILVQPGSAIVLQVHYNTANTPPAPDQTSVDVELEDTVSTPAALVPFADPSWLAGNMEIPAGSPDTTYNYALDITPYASLLSAGVLKNNVPLTVYSTALHMHTRGTQIMTRVQRANGGNDCLLDIPAWNFSWQGLFMFAKPTVVNPGDKIYLECHWNNTAANQPYVNGQQVSPMNLNWGETTEDEMCLDLLYLSE